MQPADSDPAQDPIDSVISRLPAETPRPKYAHAALLVLLFLASFLAASATQRKLLPPPEKYEFAAKLAYLREHPGEYNLVYLGASTVFRHFVPEVFDARLAQLGIHTRSFNLGTPGMTSFEFDKALRELAETDLDLDYVLLEARQYTLAMPGFRYPTERQVYSHDTTEMAKILGLTATWYPMPWPARLNALADHFTCYAWQLANYGQAPRLAKHLFGVTSEHADLTWLGAQSGYRALEDDPDPAVQRRRKRLLERPKEYIDARLALAQRRREGPKLGATQPWFYAQQIDQVREMGARPLLVISATAFAQPAMWALAELPGFPPLVSYDDPQRFREFYRAAQRFDKNHLTRKAAKQLSRHLADDFAKLLHAQQL